MSSKPSTAPADEMPRHAGPILFLRGADAERVALTALVVVPEDEAPPELEADGAAAAPDLALRRCGAAAWLYRFALPARSDAGYRCGGCQYGVDAELSGDLRIAFASCNGKEEGDLDRDPAQRNAMWMRMARMNEARPFQLLLQGGDQIYADEVTLAHPASAEWPDAVREGLSQDEAGEVGRALAEAYFDRYMRVLTMPGFAELAARVPSLAIWDDHDICDGWGSLAPAILDSAVGRLLFAAARDAYLVFQQGTAPEDVPEICPDRSGTSLAWSVRLPGVTVMAPDLRSERRPHRVMGETGWAATEALFARAPADRLLMVSSVPVLGPRLSLVERAMQATPWRESYEDDLRDQWQSRHHRGEWRRMLREMIALHCGRGAEVTVVSGEIHLATRGEMATECGPIHQLVASGITHPPPPRGYAGALGLLARTGEAPLKGHPIRLRALPGRRSIYAAERNFLVIERAGGAWSATWHLERSGQTPPLAI